MKLYWIENTAQLKGFGFTKTGTASTFLTDGTTTVAVTPTILTGSSKRIHVAIPSKSGSTAWLVPKATKLTLQFNSVTGTSSTIADLTAYCIAGASGVTDGTFVNTTTNANGLVTGYAASKIITFKQGGTASTTYFVTVSNPTF